MSNISRTFLFSRIREECRQQVYDSPTILKMRDIMGIRHGLPVTDMIVGDQSLFDRALEMQEHHGIPIDEVNSIQIKESDPDYFWLILNMAWNQLED